MPTTVQHVEISQFLLWMQNRGMEFHRVAVGEPPKPVPPSEIRDLCHQFLSRT